jgi:hypothetical protein
MLGMGHIKLIYCLINTIKGSQVCLLSPLLFLFLLDGVLRTALDGKKKRNNVEVERIT